MSFKKLLFQKKSKMTDDEFFLSSYMKQHFTGIITGVCKSFKKKISVNIKKDENLSGSTDGNTINLSIGHRWITSAKTRAEKYYLLIGVLVHECGHILFTPFELFYSIQKVWGKGRVYPEIPLSEETLKVLEEGKGPRLTKIYHTLQNCIEDGYVERLMLRLLPGYGECLMKVRHLHFQEMYLMPYAEKQRKEKNNYITELINCILFYAKFGVDNSEDAEPDKLTKAFSEVKPLVDEATKEHVPLKRAERINQIMDLIIKFMYEDLFPPKSDEDSESDSEESKDESKDSKEDSEEESTEESKDKSEDSEEESEEDSTEESEDKSEDSEEESEKDSEDKSEDEDEDIDEEVPDDASEGDEESDPGKGIGDYDDDAFEKAMKSLEESLDEFESSDSEEHKNPESPVSTETLEKEMSSDSGDELGEEKESHFEDVGPETLDLSYLEDKVAEEGVLEDSRNGVVKGMARVSDEIRKERSDKFPSQEEYLRATHLGIKDYEEKHKNLDVAAKRMADSIIRILTDMQKGDMQKGLYVGKLIDSAHAYRKDKKIMASKILPENVPDMEVVILVDCSGSMSCNNYERIDKAIECAYITWKFCELTEVPCHVYGHTTTYDERRVRMMCVAHPDTLTKKEGAQIFELRHQALRNNRDGWAIDFCGKVLEKSTATQKLLLIISDGIPQAPGYSGTAAKNDVRDVVKKYKKRGETIITAGIDSSANDIKLVYLDGVAPKEQARFLDYEDMSQLPKAFAKVIKKELVK